MQDIAQHLRLGRGGVTDQEEIDVPAWMHVTNDSDELHHANSACGRFK